MKDNYYELLGVTRESSAIEITTAYHQKLQENSITHGYGLKGTYEKSIPLKEAYVTLLDINSRNVYEKYLKSDSQAPFIEFLQENDIDNPTNKVIEINLHQLLPTFPDTRFSLVENVFKNFLKICSDYVGEYPDENNQKDFKELQNKVYLVTNRLSFQDSNESLSSSLLFISNIEHEFKESIEPNTPFVRTTLENIPTYSFMISRTSLRFLENAYKYNLEKTNDKPLIQINLGSFKQYEYQGVRSIKNFSASQEIARLAREGATMDLDSLKQTAKKEKEIKSPSKITVYNYEEGEALNPIILYENYQNQNKPKLSFKEFAEKQFRLNAEENQKFRIEFKNNNKKLFKQIIKDFANEKNINKLIINTNRNLDLTDDNKIMDNSVYINSETSSVLEYLTYSFVQADRIQLNNLEPEVVTYIYKACDHAINNGKKVPSFSIYNKEGDAIIKTSNREIKKEVKISNSAEELPKPRIKKDEPPRTPTFAKRLLNRKETFLERVTQSKKSTSIPNLPS